VLLRNVIENIEFQSISFNKELSVVQAFVELQKEMIPAPFTLKVEIDKGFDPEILIPAMIIQIPVENAIKHGLIPKESGPSEVIIRASKTYEGTMIAILDNGLGLSNLVSKTAGTGTGLKMVMQTIQFLNSKNERKMRFSINDRSITEPDQPGTVAEIFIPNEFSFIV
jgi:LytS/YehU family sensor histidine kinase